MLNYDESAPREKCEALLQYRRCKEQGNSVEILREAMKNSCQLPPVQKKKKKHNKKPREPEEEELITLQMLDPERAARRPS